MNTHFSMPAFFDGRKIEPEIDTLICFSHLRWSFVFQRPQHLMTRFAQTMRVIVFEEPIFDDTLTAAHLDTNICESSGVVVMTPRLPADWLVDAKPSRKALLAQQQLLETALEDTEAASRVFWFYTPMMLDLIGTQAAAAIVYDCMDELSKFAGAPTDIVGQERRLMQRADVVFTGGRALFEAKSAFHHNVHAFPSSVDRAHFATARSPDGDEPADQASLPHPRFGFFGVIDERMDLASIEMLADAEPQASIVMVGPVAKIDPASLPRRPNIHYLGGKSYDELPLYLAGWDVALMNFAINEATTFISPTKTPEYLAGGKPVVSTPITDVVRDYGDLKALVIADPGEAFVEGCRAALTLARDPSVWLAEVDARLATTSWDTTQAAMAVLIDKSVGAKRVRLSAPAIRPAGRRKPIDVLIVGAGPAGCVMAERCAAGSGKRVMLIDRRPHIGGNTYDHLDAAGVMVHRYGPHIFHTNSAEIVGYLSQFTRWRPYEHRVLASVGDQLLPMPINRTTLNRLYGLDLADEAAAEAFLAARAEPVDQIRTSEDVVVSKIGRDLYERFFKTYSLKQWAIDPSQLDKSVTARVPTRTNTDDRYFTDTHQAMPLDGYTRMFGAMVDHPNIHVETGVDFADVRREVDYDQLVFTGPIDEYFGFRFGKLPYRSLAFRHETLQQEQFQAVGTVNYPGADVPWTRITEYKHLTGQSHASTSITYEYGTDEGDPYYPIPRPENQELYKRYEALARITPDVHFVGRLATYRYYNMDQVIGQALATYRRMATQMGVAAKTQSRSPMPEQSVAAV